MNFAQKFFFVKDGPVEKIGIQSRYADDPDFPGSTQTSNDFRRSSGINFHNSFRLSFVGIRGIFRIFASESVQSIDDFYFGNFRRTIKVSQKSKTKSKINPKSIQNQIQIQIQNQIRNQSETKSNSDF